MENYGLNLGFSLKKKEKRMPLMACMVAEPLHCCDEYNVMADANLNTAGFLFFWICFLQTVFDFTTGCSVTIQIYNGPPQAYNPDSKFWCPPLPMTAFWKFSNLPHLWPLDVARKKTTHCGQWIHLMTQFRLTTTAKKKKTVKSGVVTGWPV